jgi:hypothetical protein
MYIHKYLLLCLLSILCIGCSTLNVIQQKQVDSAGRVIPEYKMGIRVTTLQGFWEDPEDARRRGTTLNVSQIFNAALSLVHAPAGEVVQDVNIDLNSDWIDKYVILFYMKVKY